MLTDKYVLSPEANKPSGDKLVIGQGNTLFAQPTEPSAVVCGQHETDITYSQYMQAMPQYVELHCKFNGDVVGDAWQGHFSNVINHEFRKSEWHLLVRYCIEIQRIATMKGFRPQNWHEDVYKGVKTCYEQEETQNCMVKLNAAITAAQAITQRDNMPSSSNNHKSNASHHQPPNTNSNKSNNHSFQNNETDSQNPKKQRCFNCGCDSHFVGDCKTSIFANGQHTNLTCDGKKWLLDGKPFCYNHNNPRGCL
ncbi:hypothetical protein FRC11_005983 [Ceratobasidium sp. 423]|nr:hypothetical protein FRC11_005983 [Ceratobasidium sp. 423]